MANREANEMSIFWNMSVMLNCLFLLACEVGKVTAWSAHTCWGKMCIIKNTENTVEYK